HVAGGCSQFPAMAPGLDRDEIAEWSVGRGNEYDRGETGGGVLVGWAEGNGTAADQFTDAECDDELGGLQRLDGCTCDPAAKYESASRFMKPEEFDMAAEFGTDRGILMHCGS